jgi:hypothetical protein
METIKLIDVTDSAREMVMHFPGWEVAVTQRVWDECVKVPAGLEGESETSRLWDLLCFFWDGVRQLATPETGLLAAFGFQVGKYVTDFERSLDLPAKRWPDLVDLHAVAGIDSYGSPRIVVVWPGEVFLSRH